MRLATDAAGTPLWRWDGDAFGATFPNVDPDGDRILTHINLRYPGQYYDVETGLFYNWHRYYSPALGRYITNDPIGLVGGLNTYSYVGNAPLVWSDRWGLIPPDWWEKHHPKPRNPTRTQENFSAGIGGFAMGGTGGGSASAGVIFGPGNVCFFQRYCGLLGLGFGAGVGGEFGGGVSTRKLCSATFRTVGGFAFAGGGLFGGGSASGSSSGLDVGAGLLGVGGGEAAGAMGCVIRLSCLKSCDDESCITK